MANKSAARKNRLRIIAGQWRSRQLLFEDLPELRPTPARVRETLFNWLQYDIAASRCLDLFAGSGALGFEAASRGARRVLQVERNAAACSHLRRNAAALQARQIEIVEQDVFTFLNGSPEPFSVVFLDPPFTQNLLLPCCQILEERGWLADQAKIYLEAETGLSLLGLPQNWRQLKSKTAGEVAYRLYARSMQDS